MSNAIDDVTTSEVVAVNARVVDAEVVEELKPIQVTGVLQFVIPTPNEAMHMINKSLMGIQSTLVTHTGQLEDISRRVMSDIDSINSLEMLYNIRDILNKRIRLQAVEVSFMKVNDMAQNLSVSKSFLEKNMGEIFVEGTHYTRAVDVRLVRWNVEQMHKWIKGEGRDETDNQLLSKLLD